MKAVPEYVLKVYENMCGVLLLFMSSSFSRLIVVICRITLWLHYNPKILKSSMVGKQSENINFENNGFIFSNEFGSI